MMIRWSFDRRRRGKILEGVFERLLKGLLGRIRGFFGGPLQAVSFSKRLRLFGRLTKELDFFWLGGYFGPCALYGRAQARAKGPRVLCLILIWAANDQTIPGSEKLPQKGHYKGTIRPLYGP